MTILLVLQLCLAGGELARAGQTSALPVVEMPAELPPRTAPSKADPELQDFLARVQDLSWGFGSIFGYGGAIQIQDGAGRVNGWDAQGQPQTPIPDSTYIPYDDHDAEGFAGRLQYGEPYTIVAWGKKSTLVLTLLLYADSPQVARTAYLNWEMALLRYELPRDLKLTDQGLAWLPLPTAPWTTLPAMYVDLDGNQDIDTVIEPQVHYELEAGTIPVIQHVGLPTVLPPRTTPTRIPVAQYERVLTGWRKPPPILVSQATRVILKKRSGWIKGVDEEGRGWGPVPGTAHLWIGGGNHGDHGLVDDRQEYALAEIQPIKAGKVEVVMGPLYLVPPPSNYDDVAQREAFLASDVLEIWYGPVTVTAASVLWLELPLAPWETFPALYLDRDGDQVVDEVIEAHIEIHPYKERMMGIEGVRRIL